MRRIRTHRLAAAVVVAAAAITVTTIAVRAQSTIQPVPYDPEVCVDARYDLNGDGRLDKKDVTYWDDHSARCVDRFGNALPGVECDANLDVDRDGKVDKNDLAFLYRRLVSCMFAPVFTRPGVP
jgi:hypothetical protein